MERQLEIARIEMPATSSCSSRSAPRCSPMFLLALIAPVFVILALLTPLGTKGSIERKLRQVRAEFADQLPPISRCSRRPFAWGKASSAR